MIKIKLNWLLQYKIHIIVWLIFIAYETVMIGMIFGIFGNPLTYLFHYIVIVSFFYACANGGLPWALGKLKNAWLRLPIAFLIAIGLYITFQYIADLALIKIGTIISDGSYPLNSQFMLKNLYRGSYFFGFSIGYYLLRMRDMERVERERIKQLHFENLIKQQQIEKELSLTQNAFLKAQINPHFLFNTLDFVYHSIHERPDAAAEAVIYLSRMMRFAIDSNDHGEFIRVGDEIKHVQTLINLYQLRKKDSNLPKIIYSPDIESIFFIPLVILTLAENMIKHGIFNASSSPSYMSFVITDGLFVLETKNTIGNQNKKQNSGEGLKNTENRLRIAYGDALKFKCFQDNNKQFIVRITIPINSMAF